MSKDSPEFFPQSGSFRPVVPLSELDETPDTGEDTPRAAAATHAPPAKRIADGVPARRVRVEEGGRRTPEDEEEETLVNTRRTLSTRALVPRARRRKSRLPSWPLILTCLAAMLVGGVIGDAFWKNVRRPARADEAASVAEGSSTAADVESPASQPPPSTEEANTQPPQIDPQASAAEPSAVSESEALRPAAGEPEGERPKGARAVEAEITSATVVPASARKRAAEESPAAESRFRQPSSPARGAVNKGPAETRAERPQAAPRPRARATQNQVVNSSSRDQSLPVFSPPPSNKSGKREVIPWP